MAKVEIASVAPSGLPRNDGEKEAARNDEKKQLRWVDNPSVQKLLDVISSILADEYIQIAKQTPEIFKNGGPE